VKVGGFEIDVKGKEPAIPQELQPLQEGRYKKWIVQFAGPIHEVEKKALTDLGASIGDYLPEFAFLVTMDSQARNQVEKLPFINGVVRYKPAYKISPGLKDESGGVRLDKEIVRLWIKVDDVKNVGQVLSKVQKEKGNILEVSGKVMKMEVAPSGITSLAKIEEVVWIEEVEDMEILNDTTAWVIQTNQNYDARIWDKGLHGEGQLVGIGDTGLDYDMPWFRDPAGVPIGASHRKILGYDTTYGDDYDEDVSGHGTHVAGTVGGDRTPVDGLGNANGMAPKSRFFIQDIAPAGSGSGVYPPSDLGQLFFAPYQAGARIHTNSWGGRSNAYDTLAATADNFIWEHKDFLALFANGNSGPTINTVANPATAKT
jgi:subtilisin family serine protease